MVTTKEGTASITPPEITTGSEQAGEDEVDYKVEYETLKTANAALEQRAKSAEGRLKAGVQTDDVATKADFRRFAREIQRRDIKASNTEQDEKQQALDKIAEEETKDNEGISFKDHTGKVAKRIETKIDRSGIGFDHATITPLLEKWKLVQTHDDADAVLDEIDEAIMAHLLTKPSKEGTEDINVGTGKGTPAGAKTQFTVADISEMSPEDYAKNREKILGKQ